MARARGFRVDLDKFVLWADDQPGWKRKLLPGTECEWLDAQWWATIQGKECLVSLWTNKRFEQTHQGRVSIQGCDREDILPLTKALAAQFRREVSNVRL